VFVEAHRSLSSHELHHVLGLESVLPTGRGLYYVPRFELRIEREGLVARRNVQRKVCLLSVG
jgi:hypothetical protein